jgi:hypothetical protein
VLAGGCSAPELDAADVVGTWTAGDESTAGPGTGELTLFRDGTFQASQVPLALLGQDGFDASWDSPADTTGTWTVAAAGTIPGVEHASIETVVANSDGARSRAHLYVSGTGETARLWAYVDVDAGTTYELRRTTP